MKIAIQYVKNINGSPQAVQMPLTEWERVLNNLNKYEQAFKLNLTSRRLWTSCIIKKSPKDQANTKRVFQ
jgi:hypothetical protein